MALDKVLGFFADNKEITQLIAKSVPATMGFHQANKAKRAMEDYQTKLDNIEKSRQQIVNPYANVTNPFANMQVATKAAEMQAEQADISLANTLDNLRETGAGGATALAQAALKSKQGVSASIEKQEARNQQLAAQGQQRMEQLKGAGEARRMQMQEMRDVRDINRLQQNIDIAQQQRAAGLSTGALATASGISGLSTFIKPEEINVEDNTETGFLEGYDPAKARSTIGRYGQSGDDTIEEGDVGLTLNIQQPNESTSLLASQFANPQGSTQWEKSGLTGMVNERKRLVQAGQSTSAIQALIDSTRQEFGI